MKTMKKLVSVKMVKTDTGAPAGAKVVTYKSGQIYNLPEDLAEQFVKFRKTAVTPSAAEAKEFSEIRRSPFMTEEGNFPPPPPPPPKPADDNETRHPDPPQMKKKAKRGPGRPPKNA